MALLLFLFLFQCHSGSVSDPSSMFYTPLDEYVARPDSNYRYEVQTGVTVSGPGWTGQIVKMWSQAWLTPADWNRGNGPQNDSVWWHFMTIITPDKLDSTQRDKSYLYITGASNDGNPPLTRSDNDFIGALCVQSGIVGAIIYQVPNQPIVFTEDPTQERRYEDAIIAWTWRHFVYNTEDTDWPLRLPMTKAAVRAMDTVADYFKSQATVNKFVIAGGSKRGWTTWTTALVDDRVVGIVPIVMDLLHVGFNLHHQYRAYGGWTAQFYDYYVLNMTAELDLPGYEWLFRIEDPYYYLPDPSRLLMPKLVVTAANDEFFQFDDDYYWWDYMPTSVRQQRVPNSGHSINPASFMGTVVAWVDSEVMGKGPTPDIDWSIDTKTGAITVYTDPDLKPFSVKMWSAPSADNGLRDWRMHGGVPVVPQNVEFSETLLQETALGSNTYIATQDVPIKNWVGFFVEVTYNGGIPYGSSTPAQYKFTTQASVLPMDKWVADECLNANCYGTLL